MNDLLKRLRAAAEPTRLRILGLCAQAELTVSDLTELLGQSQPRISRHLRLLVEAGLLARNQEGSWAWYLLPQEGDGASLARQIVDLLPSEERQQVADLRRLQAVSRRRADRVEDYFRQHASEWEEIRALHTDQARVDRAFLSLVTETAVDSLLDIGTGAGHVLLLAGRQARVAVGIDRSREMLNVARHNLFQAGLKNCHVRHADMMALPFDNGAFGVITMNMVLHFAERPQAAIAEAARVLKPGGRLVVVDFARHSFSEFQEQYAHRWLGFNDLQLYDWYRAAGLIARRPRRLRGGKLTVALWTAEQPASGQTHRSFNRQRKASPRA